MTDITPKEAIANLNHIYGMVAPDIQRSLDVAIKALERPQGEWIKVKENRMSIDMSGEIVTRYKCSKCGRPIATLPSKLAEYYPFCHCGADMRGRGGK